MLFSLFVEFTPCCSSQSKVALSFFLIAFPVDAETFCHLHFTDVWISPPCELPLLDFLLLFFFFSGSCWQNLQTAMYILNRQSTMLPAGQPRCSQPTHIVDQEFHRESCLWARGRGWKIFEGSQRTQPLTATYFFFQSRKESIKSKILYVKTFFRFLAFLVWNNLCCRSKH